MLDEERTDETVTETAAESPSPTAGESTDAPPAPRKRARSAAKKAAPRTKASAGSTDEAADQPLPVEDTAEAPVKPARKRAPRKKPATEAATEVAAVEAPEAEPAAEKPAVKKRAPRKSAAKKAAPVEVETPAESAAESAPETTEVAPAAESPAGEGPVDETPTEAPAKKARKKSASKRSSTKSAAVEAAPESVAEPLFQAPTVTDAPADADADAEAETDAETDAAADEILEAATVETADAGTADAGTADAGTADAGTDTNEDTDGDSDDDSEDGDGSGGRRRRRRRGGRRRRKGGGGEGSQDDGSSDGAGATASESGDSSETASADQKDDAPAAQDGDGTDGDEQGSGVTSKRRRRRRRIGDADSGGDDDGQTVTRVRRARSPEDEITSVAGSTRLEAKKQRRREGREAGRRRAPIVSEAEFLARRESVDRTMVVRQRDDLTQIAVLEDGVMVEHYVARESQTSLIGNVYLGRVQNVLPSMEAAFVDIGKGRNAVIYAGEVNWAALGHVEGQPRKIESVLSSGQSILVQVTKDPIGHKGARLTSQVSLAGRFLVLVPDGTTSGISRKLPDTERARLKAKLKEIVPDGAGVIVRTAAEGATEEQLTHDVERLTSRWADIESASKGGKGGAPKLLYGEPDLTLKVVRDLFTEDFKELLIEGDGAWDTIHDYVMSVAPDLEERLTRFQPGENGKDVFGVKRIDEQIAKGLDRKVWLPSGGSLIFDRTEAMTVVDVNTGKFTGSGGNLEETVTKNNLEAAEELVRQLRLRDIGGIIVVDFIDMVLESNRDLVLRRLVECLGRDRTRHQVAEVSSLGLVQMTRKRIGTGLLESFSETCQHCAGSGVSLSSVPVDSGSDGDDDGGRGRRRGGKGRNGGGNGGGTGGNGGNGGDNGGARTETAPKPSASPSYVAAVAKPENADKPPIDEQDAPVEDAPAAEQAPVAVAPEEAPDATADPEPTDPSLVSEPAVPEPEPEPAPVDTTPRTVTRTSRRRSAGRPAGSPAGAVAAVVVTTPDQTSSTAADPAPADASETPVPPPPTVVTRTRGRGGRRVPARGVGQATPEQPQD